MEVRWFTRIWADGDYFDLWHVNHFLAGMLCAGATVFLQINLWLGLTLSIVAMLVWEIYEILKHIKETSFNKIMDVALGVAGFFVFYPASVSASFRYFFLVALVLWLTLELWGFLRTGGEARVSNRPARRWGMTAWA